MFSAALAVLAAVSTTPAAADSDINMMMVLKNVESFGSELLRKTRAIAESMDPDANVFISPHSVYTALSMLAAGTRGATREQLMQSLLPKTSLSDFGDEEVQDFHEAVREVLAYTERAGFNVSNGVWGRGITSYYSKSIEDLYHAETGTLGRNASGIINAWIENKTNGLIKDIVSRQMLWNVVAVLVNTIYFKQDWETAFKPSLNKLQFTTPNDHVVSVESMSTERNLHYCLYTDKGTKEEYHVVFVPYENDASAAVIAVPLNAENVTLDSNLPDDFIAEAYDQAESTLVNLRIPTLDLSETYDMKDTLRQMGVPMAGDFSLIAPPLHEISDIVHATALNVDENGTEAAAATVITAMRGMKLKPDPIQVVADRPFVFGIVRLAEQPLQLEMPSKLSTVFIGSINKPGGGTVDGVEEGQSTDGDDDGGEEEVEEADEQNQEQQKDQQPSSNKKGGQTDDEEEAKDAKNQTGSQRAGNNKPFQLIEVVEGGNFRSEIAKKRMKFFKKMNKKSCSKLGGGLRCGRRRKAFHSISERLQSFKDRTRSRRVSGNASTISAAQQQTPCKVGSISCTWFYVLIVGMIALLVSVGIGAVLVARRGASSSSSSSSAPSSVQGGSVKGIDVDSL